MLKHWKDLIKPDITKVAEISILATSAFTVRRDLEENTLYREMADFAFKIGPTQDELASVLNSYQTMKAHLISLIKMNSNEFIRACDTLGYAPNSELLLDGVAITVKDRIQNWNELLAEIESNISRLSKERLEGDDLKLHDTFMKQFQFNASKYALEFFQSEYEHYIAARTRDAWRAFWGLGKWFCAAFLGAVIGKVAELIWGQFFDVVTKVHLQ